MHDVITEVGKGKFGGTYTVVTGNISTCVWFKDKEGRPYATLFRDLDSCDPKTGWATSAVLVMWPQKQSLNISFKNKEKQDKTAENIASLIGPSMDALHLEKDAGIKLDKMRGSEKLLRKLQAGLDIYSKQIEKENLKTNKETPSFF